MAVREVVVADERIVDQGLEDDGHEAGTPHVEKAAKAGGAAGGGGGVLIDVSQVFGGWARVGKATTFAA